MGASSKTIRLRRLYVLVTCFLVSGVFGRHDLRADNLLGPVRNRIVLPDAAERIQGFTVQLEVGQLKTPGYVPVRITLQSPGRFAADRSLVIRFRSEPQLETPPQNGLIVDVPVTAAQGATSETRIEYLPKWSAGQAVSVMVMEEGLPLEGYETFFGGEDLTPNTTTRFRTTARSRRRLLDSEYAFNVVFVSDDNYVTSSTPVPDFANLLYVPDAVEGSRRRMQVGDGFARTGFWSVDITRAAVDTIGVRQLPLDWRAYQRYDLVVMDRLAMQRLREHPDELRTLRDWMLNGGNVIVYNVASGEEISKTLEVTWTPNAKHAELIATIAYEQSELWQRSLSEARSLVRTYVQSVDRMASELKAATDPSAAGSKGETDEFSDFGSEGDPSDDVPVNSGERVDAGDLQRQLEYAETELDRLRQAAVDIEKGLEIPLDQWRELIQVQAVGGGYLMAIKPVEHRETPSLAHWRIVAEFLDFRVSPTLRRGVDPLIGDRRFSRWLIPGVAQPPVYTFMGLLSAFVILVGPIAYRRTTRAGRSYLMFAIAPALALMTTIAMFGYGILSDGFGTVVRVRQLTWVDGQSGDAGERVRSTYFAGVRPGEGLRFSDNAELMVYQESTGQSWEDLDQLASASFGRVVLDEGTQHLDASFLPSRQQRQFVVHAPRHEVGFLQVVPDPQGVLSPEITSRFSFPIRQLVVRDSDAVYWTIDSLAPGEAKRGQQLTTREASKLLGQLYNDHRPFYEVRETRSTSNRYDNQIYDLILDINRSLETRASITEGVFEFWLEQHLQTNGEIPNQHFVAISEISPDVLAVEGCEINSSVRYVFGTVR